ncbi:poly-gamma-glutamate synthase PgsB [Alsobacter sp. SYSU M60028]|uniref:Poly-gamma-glutamate synthase PgsB n=1 Tax=Alsobacter ponti TaxID=2962936 RepID=A0ABT1L6D9_9HYPH|nr:poly-gamma-glutamate synthase PgsB [Alsobacter ponti]MCP8936915.1 poly-gamma-glutamate synthase PgsB [Alsobacter ponti]
MPAFLLEPVWGEPVASARLLAIAGAALALAVAWLWTRARALRLARERIAVRIHVAGTRGKSTTTRLVAAGLRGSGLAVIGKTTGSEPRLIRADGSEEAIRRLGPPSIREQAWVLRRAAREGADAVVLECMAIQPETLWASETLLVGATTLVVTNARPDHFEEIGEDEEAMARSLAWLVPSGGVVVATREAATPAFVAAVEARGAVLVPVDTDGLPPDAANRRLALAVCARHGVSEETALAGMADATPDPGHFTEREVSVGGKTVRFANAFACNDVESLDLLWRERAGEGRPVVLLNARADRPVRTRHFLDFLARQTPEPIVLLAGDGLAAALARRAGFGPGALRRLRTRRASEALAEAVAAASPGGVVWGVGNYHGLGRQLTVALAEAGKPC